MKNFTLNNNTLFLVITFLFSITFGFGQTTLSPGDVVITGFNSDNPDQFSFVLLTDITATTQIKFTDNGLQTIAYNIVDEGIITWTADTDLDCGTEVIITDLQMSNMYSATLGTAVETGGGFGLATNGDQILVFQGTISIPTYLFAVTFDSTGWLDSDSQRTTMLPPGLTDGVNALDLGEIDNANYNCTVINDLVLISAAVSTSTNWMLQNTPRLALGGCYYSCCTSTTWNGTNFTPIAVPDLTTHVIIDADFNTTAHGSFSACSLNINNNYTLSIDNNTYVEVENSVTGDGDIYIDTEGAIVQNDDAGTFNLNGTATLFKLTATKQKWYYYTYWSSPVENETVLDAFPNTPADRRFLFNAANYLDSDGDDIDDNADDWEIVPAASILTPGMGYAATSSTLGMYPSTDSADFIGNFNTGDITTNIFYNGANGDNDWNFIGNPYPSALDFDLFYAANSAVIDGAAYFWSQSLPPDDVNPGNEGQNFNMNDYAMYNTSGGITPSANGNIPDQFIPSAQGFFVIGLANGNVTFSNSMRSTGNNNDFYRTTISNEKERLWVNLTSDNGVFNQILVAYVNGATDDYDSATFDAPRNLSTGNAAIIYTTIEGETKKFAIQGKHPNSLNSNEVVPFGIKNTIEVDTQFKLSIAQLEGEFMNNNAIYLKDNVLNVYHNLSESDYTFTSEVGEFNERFEIRFASTLSVNELNYVANELIVVNNENEGIDISTSLHSQITNIKIYDLLGRELEDLDVSNKTLVSLDTNAMSTSVYITKVTLENGRILTKKILK